MIKLASSVCHFTNWSQGVSVVPGQYYHLAGDLVIVTVLFLVRYCFFAVIGTLPPLQNRGGWC
jgi:hypothetical protein